MAYIGVKPTIGNFQICDAISVVNGQAAYTMQVGSVNVSPQSANHMIVSLNGVIQKPGSSYTVSGNTITFASNLATGDVIDFIQILGDVLDLGVPSDATVTAAKLTANSITGQTAETSIATDDTVLIHDTSAGALRKMTRANFVSGIGGTMTPAFEAYLSGNQSGVSDNTNTKVQFDTEIYDTANAYDNSSNYRFTPQTAGKYFVYTSVRVQSTNNTQLKSAALFIRKNNSEVGEAWTLFWDNYIRSHTLTKATVVDMNGSSDYLEVFAYGDANDDSMYGFIGGSGQVTNFGAYKIIE